MPHGTRRYLFAARRVQCYHDASSAGPCSAGWSRGDYEYEYLFNQ